MKGDKHHSRDGKRGRQHAGYIPIWVKLHSPIDACLCAFARDWSNSVWSLTINTHFLWDMGASRVRMEEAGPCVRKGTQPWGHHQESSDFIRPWRGQAPDAIIIRNITVTAHWMPDVLLVHSSTSPVISIYQSWEKCRYFNQSANQIIKGLASHSLCNKEDNNTNLPHRTVVSMTRQCIM